MQATRILRTSCALGAILISAVFVQPYQWKIIQGSGNRYLAGLEQYKRDLAGLGKKT